MRNGVRGPAQEGKSFSQGCLAWGGSLWLEKETLSLKFFPDYLTCSDPLKLGETCGMREERTEERARLVGTQLGGGQRRAVELRSPGSRASRHSGFRCPLVDIVGSAQPIAFPTVARFAQFPDSPSPCYQSACGAYWNDKNVSNLEIFYYYYFFGLGG